MIAQAAELLREMTVAERMHASLDASISEYDNVSMKDVIDAVSKVLGMKYYGLANTAWVSPGYIAPRSTMPFQEALSLLKRAREKTFWVYEGTATLYVYRWHAQERHSRGYIFEPEAARNIRLAKRVKIAQ